MDGLLRLIIYLVYWLKKKLVLFIDEVDVSSNYWLFFCFLGMLWSKYFDWFFFQYVIFYSVVLVGVYDVKLLKFRICFGEDNIG